MGDLVSQPEIEPLGPLYWECGVLTTGPPEKSPNQVSESMGTKIAQGSEGTTYMDQPPSISRAGQESPTKVAGRPTNNMSALWGAQGEPRF